MKSFTAAGAFFVLAAITTGSSWNGNQTRPISAKLTKVVGDVEVRSPLATDWHRASPNSELTADCELRTKARSFVMVTFKDGSKVIVRERSVIKILEDSAGGGRGIGGLLVRQGNIAFEISDQKTAVFQIASPISVALTRHAKGAFIVDSASSLSEISLGEGTAEFSSSIGACKLIVPAGHPAQIDSTGCRLN
jgi:hypothetical protein